MNYSTNPSLESNTTGYSVDKWFSTSRVQATWGSGKWVGQVMAHPPAKPTKLRDRPKAPLLGKQGSMTAAQSYPAPLAFDIPGDSPLTAVAPVDIKELVAGRWPAPGFPSSTDWSPGCLLRHGA